MSNQRLKLLEVQQIYERGGIKSLLLFLFLALISPVLCDGAFVEAQANFSTNSTDDPKKSHSILSSILQSDYLSVESQSMSFDTSTNVYDAEGGVKIKLDPYNLSCDSLKYDPAQKALEANKDIKITSLLNDNLYLADSLFLNAIQNNKVSKYNSNNKQINLESNSEKQQEDSRVSQIHNLNALLRRGLFFLHADKITFSKEDVYIAENFIITFCDFCSSKIAQISVPQSIVDVKKKSISLKKEDKKKMSYRIRMLHQVA